MKIFDETQILAHTSDTGSKFFACVDELKGGQTATVYRLNDSDGFECEVSIDVVGPLYDGGTSFTEVSVHDRSCSFAAMRMCMDIFDGQTEKYAAMTFGELRAEPEPTVEGPGF